MLVVSFFLFFEASDSFFMESLQINIWSIKNTPPIKNPLRIATKRISILFKVNLIYLIHLKSLFHLGPPSQLKKISEALPTT